MPTIAASARLGSGVRIADDVAAADQFGAGVWLAHVPAAERLAAGARNRGAL